MVGERELEVVEVEIEADKDDADGGVEMGAAFCIIGDPGGDGGVVFRRNGSSEGWVRAADVGYVFRVEFLLDARLADDEDGAFCGGELRVDFGQDAGDVDGGAV